MTAETGGRAAVEANSLLKRFAERSGRVNQKRSQTRRGFKKTKKKRYSGLCIDKKFDYQSALFYGIKW